MFTDQNNLRCCSCSVLLAGLGVHGVSG
jgi:hypothetical protein